MNDKIVLVCDCGRIDHAVCLSRWPDFPGVYVTVELATDVPLWVRVKAAWRYVWGLPCCYGYAAETLLSPEDVARVAAWLTRTP
jgi:hypothetical protein